MKTRTDQRHTSCLACDYDLHGLPAEHVCPECGLAYSQENFAVVTPKVGIHHVEVAMSLVAICWLVSVLITGEGLGEDIAALLSQRLAAAILLPCFVVALIGSYRASKDRRTLILTAKDMRWRMHGEWRVIPWSCISDIRIERPPEDPPKIQMLVLGVETVIPADFYSGTTVRSLLTEILERSETKAGVVPGSFSKRSPKQDASAARQGCSTVPEKKYFKPITNCPNCSYNLKGLPKEHNCPECGNPFRASDLVMSLSNRMYAAIGLIGAILIMVALLFYLNGSPPLFTQSLRLTVQQQPAEIGLGVFGMAVFAFFALRSIGKPAVIQVGDKEVSWTLGGGKMQTVVLSEGMDVRLSSGSSDDPGWEIYFWPEAGPTVVLPSRFLRSERQRMELLREIRQRIEAIDSDGVR